MYLIHQGKSLEAVLHSPFKPTVIKPNREELSQLLGRDVSADFEDLKEVLKDPLFEGNRMDYRLLRWRWCLCQTWDSFYKVDIPKIEVVNPVGSGDSTVAGISAALSSGKDDAALLTHAMVLGMLNAQEKMTGHVNMAHYDDLYQNIIVKRYKMVLTEQKRNYLEKLSTKEGVISALAFDQRGALKRLMAQYQDTEPTVAQMEELKVLVAEELTPFASSMLLDPEYGPPATKVLDAEAGLFVGL